MAAIMALEWWKGMKEVFRHADPALVELYQSMVNDAGIPTYIRNANTQQSLVAGLITAVCPLSLFYPTLCVVNDEDHPEAVQILHCVKESAAQGQKEWKCSRCGEIVPGNLTGCWKCQTPRNEDGSAF
jgi:hypothetical protein